MRRPKTMILAALALALSAGLATPVVAKPWGMSRDAVGLDVITGQDGLSPNGASRVRATPVSNNERESQDAQLVISGAIGEITLVTSGGAKTEVSWAPDSMALFVTAPRQDRAGALTLTLVRAIDGHLQTRDLTPLIAEAYGAPVSCATSEDVDVGGLMWAGRSTRLLVAAQTPPNGRCAGKGAFKVYDVDLATLKILRTYWQPEAKTVFGGAMGLRLLQAGE